MLEGLYLFVGKLFLLYVVIRVGIWAYRQFGYKANVASYASRGSWAVITGCTNGIGKGFAEAFAARGVNLVLVSRDEQKLKELADTFETTSNIKTKIVAIKFGDETAEAYSAKLQKAIEDIDNVSVLINNVGIANEVPTLFLDLTAEECRKMIDVNINSALEVTRVVLPKMVLNKRGVVVNLGSYTGDFPTPFISVYSATKCFLDAWSKAMHDEYADKGINIICVKPRYVQSNMTGFKRVTTTVISPRQLAEDTLKNVGGFLAPVSFSPNAVHALQIFATSLAPQMLLSYFSLSAMNAVRSKMLKRKESAKQ